jgi:HSP20 family protein
MLYRNMGISPFSLRREIDRLFEDALGGGRGATGWQPSVDVREDPKELRLGVELPGIRPEDIEITVENGVLTIRGEKRDERREEDEQEGRYHLIERSYGSFMRSFQLPQGLDEDSISADFEHGVLQVRIPKAALPQPRKIQISASGGKQRVGAGQGGQGGQAQGGERGSAQGGGQTGTRGSSTRSGTKGAQGEGERDRMAARGTEK